MPRPKPKPKAKLYKVNVRMVKPKGGAWKAQTKWTPATGVTFIMTPETRKAIAMAKKHWGAEGWARHGSLYVPGMAALPVCVVGCGGLVYGTGRDFKDAILRAKRDGK